MIEDALPGSEPNPVQQVEEAPRDYVGGVSWLVFGLTLLAWAFLWWLNSISHSPQESRWLVALFGLPLLGEIIGSVVLFHRPRRDKRLSIFHWFYLAVISLCITSFQAFWGFYLLYKMGQSPFSPRTLSAFAVCSVAILVGLVIAMTLAIMCQPPRERRDKDGRFAKTMLGATALLHNLKAGAAQEPFLALLLFFTVFLGVSYLFGFAFAFHDKSLPANQPALYKKNLRASRSGDSSSHAKPQVDSFRFEFDNLQAIPDIESNPPDVQTDLKPLAERKDKNFKTLQAIVDHISQVRASDAVRIIVTGHASDPVPQDGPYPSNYELSQARAENVRRKIIEALAKLDQNRWRNIEWLCLSASSESEPLTLGSIAKQLRDGKTTRSQNPGTKYARNGMSEEKFVDVRIDQPRMHSTTVQMDHLESDFPVPLDLIDYIYFANYTITTTGYGDIVPSTAYAKFVCSLANICEVFFLVVFFNALLSLKGERHVPGERAI